MTLSPHPASPTSVPLAPFMDSAKRLQQDKAGVVRDAMLEEIAAAKRAIDSELAGGLTPAASEDAKQKRAALAAAEKIITIVWHVSQPETQTD